MWQVFTVQKKPQITVVVYSFYLLYMYRRSLLYDQRYCSDKIFKAISNKFDEQWYRLYFIYIYINEQYYHIVTARWFKCFSYPSPMPAKYLFMILIIYDSLRFNFNSWSICYLSILISNSVRKCTLWDGLHARSSTIFPVAYFISQADVQYWFLNFQLSWS